MEKYGWDIWIISTYIEIYKEWKDILELKSLISEFKSSLDEFNNWC